MILLGMSFALQRGDNVRVDVFYAQFSPQKKFIVDVISALLTIVVSLIFIKLSISYVEQSLSIGEGSPDPGGIPARWAIKSLIPIGFCFVALQGAAELMRLMLAHKKIKANNHV
jgi:TRAP-type mannitol/chloroaromatic compound transport system permease small subunit